MLEREPVLLLGLVGVDDLKVEVDIGEDRRAAARTERRVLAGVVNDDDADV